MLKENNSNKKFIYKHGARHFFKENSIIYRENNYSNNFYYIHEGLVTIYTSTSKGNERILNIGYPGQFIGVLAFNSNKHLTTAKTIEDTVLYQFSFSDITKLIYNNPQFLNLITNSIRHNTSVLTDTLYLDSLSARQKLALLIILYVNDFENDRISLTINHFTKYTGLTRVTIYQILREWEKEEVVELKGRNFHILNLNYIKEYLKS